MSRSHELEKLFDTVLSSEGGPVISAHVLAQTSGFTMDGDGLPTGHNDLVYALGLVSGGLCALKLSEEGEGNYELAKDDHHDYLWIAYLTPQGIEELIRDLSTLVSEAEGGRG